MVHYELNLNSCCYPNSLEHELPTTTATVSSVAEAVLRLLFSSDWHTIKLLQTYPCSKRNTAILVKAVVSVATNMAETNIKTLAARRVIAVLGAI